MKKTLLLLAVGLIGVNAEAKDHHRHANGAKQNRVHRSYPYNYRPSQSMPKGLVKRNGDLPPGLEKREMRKGQLPPGIEKRNPYPVRIVR